MWRKGHSHHSLLPKRSKGAGQGTGRACPASPRAWRLALRADAEPAGHGGTGASRPDPTDLPPRPPDQPSCFSGSFICSLIHSTARVPTSCQVVGTEQLKQTPCSQGAPSLLGEGGRQRNEEAHRRVTRMLQDRARQAEAGWGRLTHGVPPPSLPSRWEEPASG